ncbi:MAG: hypothetical protein UW79_C0022G0011 [Candidatus Yanofskybacteria bacterium GW2011_GWA2_44_9]|uniref:Uncharacterized protein n=1 Tax=Candidatus Yanofskybacteria bacterium GW2011_GWA2_44_9 TaxID=1619025 RepID=A0A0G1KC09_9BACT|nr:MAG: hypothetical protein UW79_C0022G0011 [Candidatus Yanofskybacteria bacterium GW2011_GWA2_44_9]
MTRERFAEILKEYDYSDQQIEILWNGRPTDELDEEDVRERAQRIAPIKDRLFPDR